MWTLDKLTDLNEILIKSHIAHIGTNFSEILIEIHIVSFKKMHLQMSSAKWRSFCLGLDVKTADSEI